jgi:hypothetical protein
VGGGRGDRWGELPVEVVADVESVAVEGVLVPKAASGVAVVIQGRGEIAPRGIGRTDDDIGRGGTGSSDQGEETKDGKESA